MANLQEKLESEFGRRYITRLELPDYFDTSLSPSHKLRPYQEECFRYFLTNMSPENDFEGKQTHLLFHMATGSGKTLIMAGAMLYLYEQGYRNFLFFVDSTNIVEKTKDNFLNASSSKYLFAPQIEINGKHVEIRKVDNFQGASSDTINLCLCTIQGLHSDLNSEKENAVTYDDFTDQPVVLISDEAHHMNAATKRGGISPEDEQHTKDWESTVMRIFNKDNGFLPNILLDFTATADLTDPTIAHKYEDKVIFDYPLKKFREDMYSKDVEVLESDLEPLDMALQAVILSQYKRKLFADIKQNIKPVVLLKSKTIAANKEIFTQFKQAVSNFNESGVNRIRARAKDDLAAAFDYFDKHHITASNLILELQADFSEERLLLVDGNNISPEKQLLLNSLEDADNEIRAIFAVDMLNEGWDVLNLYDIVRLYNTRDPNTRTRTVGKTTMQEAQLIGRGARYMPFKDPSNPALDADKRKYDGDAKNPLRVIEKLHYHSAYNPRYIQELHTALVETGIIPDTKIQLDLFLKKEFKESRLYEKGLVFLNRRIPLAEAEDDGTIGKDILQKTFTVSVHTGQMHTNKVFSENEDNSVITTKTLPIKFKDIDYHVVRAAMNSFTSFSFDQLKKLYPQLKSGREFITSEKYLANLDIKINGLKASISEYSQSDKLMIAKSVLKEIEPLLLMRGKTYRGTKEFKPFQIKDKFRDVIRLNVTIPPGNQEFGIAMSDPRTKYPLKLSAVDWYAYNENYGTSEEKALVKYIEGIMPKLEEKYDEIYLVRNEKDIKIYSFDTGQAFEPDFVLFLRIKGTSDKYDNLQLFIEPKGDGLMKQDKWKNDFLKQIKQTAEIHYCTSVDNYIVWGIPFFNESNNKEFEVSFNDEVLKYTPTSALKSFAIIASHEVPKEKRYVQFLPVYSVRAACGSFEDHSFIPENEAEGWLDITDAGIKANENMFIVHAIGNSMSPKINDGDLCLFELFESGGTREGEIVLTQCIDKDDDYGCSYTIKKYHSEKSINENDTLENIKVELISLNSDYCSIVLDKEKEYKTIGIFKRVL